MPSPNQLPLTVLPKPPRLPKRPIHQIKVKVKVQQRPKVLHPRRRRPLAVIIPIRGIGGSSSSRWTADPQRTLQFANAPRLLERKLRPSFSKTLLAPLPCEHEETRHGVHFGEIDGGGDFGVELADAVDEGPEGGGLGCGGAVVGFD